MMHRGLIVVTLMLLAGVSGYASEGDVPEESPHTIALEPTHPQVVNEMLKLAQLGPGDVIYDLGCGDGRFVIAGVKKFGADRGVGIDIDPTRVRESKENAELAGVTDRTIFLLGDIYESRFADATVVAIYLLPDLNVRLRPMLYQQLKPGSRIVSHSFDMGDWEPDETRRHPHARDNRFFLWVIPAKAGGEWKWNVATDDGNLPVTMTIDQEFQLVNATLSVHGAEGVPASAATLRGKSLSVEAELTVNGTPTTVKLEGQVEGDRIIGTQQWTGLSQANEQEWNADRMPANLEGTWALEIQCTGVRSSPERLIVRRNPYGELVAYTVTQGEEELLWHFYDFGGTMRMEMPLGFHNGVLTGAVSGDTMAGRIYLQGLPHDGTWTATRVTD